MWSEWRCDGRVRAPGPNAPASCNTLLLRYDPVMGGRFEVKCPRCKQRRVITVDPQRPTVPAGR